MPRPPPSRKKKVSGLAQTSGEVNLPSLISTCHFPFLKIGCVHMLYYAWVLVCVARPLYDMYVQMYDYRI